MATRDGSLLHLRLASKKAWTVATSEEMKAQRERNKELRRQLQGNSYEIGTDEDYM